MTDSDYRAALPACRDTVRTDAGRVRRDGNVLHHAVHTGMASGRNAANSGIAATGYHAVFHHKVDRRAGAGSAVRDDAGGIVLDLRSIDHNVRGAAGSRPDGDAASAAVAAVVGDIAVGDVEFDDSDRVDENPIPTGV